MGDAGLEALVPWGNSESTNSGARGELQAQGQGPLFSERSERKRAEASAKN